MTGTLRIAQTEELQPGELAALTALCEAAFDEPFARVWERIGPGIHVIAEADGRAVAHAMVIDRRLYFGHEPDTAVDVGYVENVASLPELQGQGHGTTVMREIGRIIRDEYALGALGTGSNTFYERLGWETWRRTDLRPHARRRARSQSGRGRARHDPAHAAHRARPGSHGPIAVDWRAEEPW